MNTFSLVKTYRWAGFLVGLALLFSCNDDLNEVGLEISPGSHVLVFHDSLTMLNSYTLSMEDTIRINPSNLIAGFINDPRVGLFQNNFMAEVNTKGKPYTFGKNPVADSVVLFLNYTSINGDTLTEQTIAFYELKLTEDLIGINNIPNSDSIAAQFYDPNGYLTNFTFTPPNKDSVFRIKLPQLLAERLIDPNNVKYYDTVPNFNWYVFRGIYAMAKPLAHGGGTCNFSISDSTFIQLFYQNDYTDSLDEAYFLAKGRDTNYYLTYNYNINSSTTKCNLFKRELNPGINITPYNTEPVPASEQDLCYVKGFNTFETRIDITGLSTWADSGYFAINKAFLTVYSDYTDTDSIEEQTYPPSSLDIYRLDTAYSKKIVTDYYNSSTGGSGSVGYDTATNAYNIKLTQQLYNTIKEGKDTLSIVLTPQNNRTAPNRMILRGAIHPDTPMKLNITYTKIN